jgi:hypothetical protein
MMRKKLAPDCTRMEPDFPQKITRKQSVERQNPLPEPL